MFDPDDAVAAARFRDAVRFEPAEAEEEAARGPAGTTTLDFSRFRARRVRERLLGLLETLAVAIDRRDIAAVWRVLDTGEACRCFPPGLREEALMLAQLPIGSFRAPMRLYRYQHLLTRLGDEPLEVACDPAQLVIDLASPTAAPARPVPVRELSFPGGPLPDGTPGDGGTPRRRSGSR
jgi:hypothetical protein